MSLDTAMRFVDAYRAITGPSEEIIREATKAIGSSVAPLRAKLVEGDMLCLRSSSDDVTAQRLVYEAAECLARHHGDVLLPYTFLRLAFPTEESWISARDTFFSGIQEDEAISFQDLVRILSVPELGTTSYKSVHAHAHAHAHGAGHLDREMRAVSRSVLEGRPNGASRLMAMGLRSNKAIFAMLVLFFILLSVVSPGMARATTNLALDTIGSRAVDMIQGGTNIFNALSHSEITQDGEFNIVGALRRKDERDTQLTALALMSLECRIGTDQEVCAKKVVDAFDTYVGLGRGGSESNPQACYMRNWGVQGTYPVLTRSGHPLIAKTIYTNIDNFDPVPIETSAIRSLESIRNLLKPEIWEEMEDRLKACGGLDISVHRIDFWSRKYSARAFLGTASIEVTETYTDSRDIIVHELTHLTQAPSVKVTTRQDYDARRRVEEDVYKDIVTSPQFANYIAMGFPAPYGATNPREMASEYAAMLHSLFHEDGPMFDTRHRMFLQDWFLDKIEPHHNLMYRIPMSNVRERARNAQDGGLWAIDVAVIALIVHWALGPPKRTV